MVRDENVRRSSRSRFRKQKRKRNADLFRKRYVDRHRAPLLQRGDSLPYIGGGAFLKAGEERIAGRDCGQHRAAEGFGEKVKVGARRGGVKRCGRGGR